MLTLDFPRERDLLHKVFTEKRVGLYAGVDPTAPSLHIGHMLPFMVLAWAYVWGLPAVFLVGDPSVLKVLAGLIDPSTAWRCYVSSR